MTTLRANEYRIARATLQRRPAIPHAKPLYAQRFIAILGLAGGLLLFGSLLPELVIAGLAGSLIWGLAGR